MTEAKPQAGEPVCQQEIFYNKFGSRGAVVCSCGFAVTFTVLTNDAERIGREFFARMHEYYNRHPAAVPVKHATPEDIAAQREAAYRHGSMRGERQAVPVKQEPPKPCTHLGFQPGQEYCEICGQSVPAAQPEPEGERQEVRCKWCGKPIRYDRAGIYRLTAGGKHSDMCDANKEHCFHEPSSPSTQEVRCDDCEWHGCGGKSGGCGCKCHRGSSSFPSTDTEREEEEGIHPRPRNEVGYWPERVSSNSVTFPSTDTEKLMWQMFHDQDSGLTYVDLRDYQDACDKIAQLESENRELKAKLAGALG